jgi:O-antigen/teichoic acid export membrane protein
MKSSLAKGAAYLTLSSIIFMASGYIINIWLGKTLGPKTYGTYGIVISIMSLINIMQTAGLPQAVSKFIASRDDVPKSIFSTAAKLQVVSTFVLTIIYILLAFPIAIVLGDKELVKYLIFSALVLPFYGLFSLYLGFYNGLHYFRRQALMNNLYSVAKLIFVVLLTMKFKVYGAIAGFIIAPIFALLAGARELPVRHSNYSWKKLFIFSSPLVAFAIISTMLLSIDLFILKAVHGVSENIGFYVAAQNIARLPYYALNAIAVVLLPGIAVLSKDKDHEKAQTLIKRSLRLVLILLITTSVMLIISSKGVTQLLFSSEYLPGEGALQILSLGYGLLTLFTIFTSILSGAGKPGISLKISILGLVTSISSCLMLIPYFGLIGAAWGTTIGATMASIVSFLYIKKNYHITFPYFAFLRISVCALLASLPLLYLTTSVALVAAYILSAALYLLLLKLTRELTIQDIVDVKEFLPSWAFSGISARGKK